MSWYMEVGCDNQGDGVVEIKVGFEFRISSGDHYLASASK